MSKIADRLTKFNEGFLPLLAVREKSKSAEAANALAAAQFGYTQEQDARTMLLDTVKLQAEALKSDLSNQQEIIKQFSTALSENDELLEDEAFMRMYATAQESYNKSKQGYYTLLKIPMPPTQRALDIARHIRSLIEPIGRRWSDGTTPDIIKKTYPDADMETIKLIWQGLDSVDPVLGKKDKSSALPIEILDSLNFNPRGMRSGSSAPTPEQEEQPTEPASSGAFNPRGMLGKSSNDTADLSVLGNFLNLLVSPAQASGIPDDFDELRSNEYNQLVPTDGSGIGIPDNFRDLRRDKYGNLVETFPTGETSQLLSPEVISELQSMNKRYSGTGGVLSFAEGLRLSPKAEEFLANLMAVSQQYGGERARTYMTRELVKLSVADQEAVLNALEEQNENNWGGDFLDTLKYMATGNPYNSDGTRRHYGPELNYPWSHWFKDSE